MIIIVHQDAQIPHVDIAGMKFSFPPQYLMVVFAVLLMTSLVKQNAAYYENEEVISLTIL